VHTIVVRPKTFQEPVIVESESPAAAIPTGHEGTFAPGNPAKTKVRPLLPNTYSLD
jgi:hypothetical protein